MHFELKAFNDLDVLLLYKILQLRQQVFIVEQNCPYLDADDKDQEAFHLLLFDDNKSLVGYTRLLNKGISYPNHSSIGRVLNAESTRGLGIGKKLMKESIIQIKKLYPKLPIKISAQCYLINFYQSIGFETIGSEYLEDDIPHISMIME